MVPVRGLPNAGMRRSGITWIVHLHPTQMSAPSSLAVGSNIPSEFDPLHTFSRISPTLRRRGVTYPQNPRKSKSCFKRSSTDATPISNVL